MLIIEYVLQRLDALYFFTFFSMSKYPMRCSSVGGSVVQCFRNSSQAFWYTLPLFFGFNSQRISFILLRSVCWFGRASTFFSSLDTDTGRAWWFMGVGMLDPRSLAGWGMLGNSSLTSLSLFQPGRKFIWNSIVYLCSQQQLSSDWQKFAKFRSS